MLEVRQLNVAHGPVHALHDVSLAVGTGSLVSIVGANCAGKSTLINSISGIVHPLSGAIFLDGEDIVGQPPHELVRKGIVQVPEGRKLFARMTVEENLLLGATVIEARHHRAKAMDRVMAVFPRLRERRRQIAGSLSGGEQQMVAIARAMMSRPRLLMLDEPSLGLAPIMVQELFRVLTELNQQGLTVLLVEQNVEESLALCDHGYVLEAGRVMLEGSRDELLENQYLKEVYLGLELD